MERLRVAILGGGIAGLASAYHLARAGAAPVVFEASDHLGGLGATFEHEGAILDRFYHVLLDSDEDLFPGANNASPVAPPPAGSASPDLTAVEGN